jgi:hypothetical protein
MRCQRFAYLQSILEVEGIHDITTSILHSPKKITADILAWSLFDNPDAAASPIYRLDCPLFIAHPAQVDLASTVVKQKYLDSSWHP